MQKRLFRSVKDKMLAGVCGGLAEYFDIDPVLVRVAFVVFTLGVGFGILAYIILWIVVPQRIMIINGAERTPDIPEDISGTNESAESNDINLKHKSNHGGRTIAGVILILIGLLWFFDNVFPWMEGHLWPLILVAIGLLILFKPGKQFRSKS